MKQEPVTGIQPAVLRWARETVGLSVPEVAQRLKRSADEVDAWESGRAAPTYSQLEKLAYQVYKRPLAVFFLPAPPQEAAPNRELRTLPDADLNTLARDTHLHIRRAHAYQLALDEIFEGRSPADHPIWKRLSLAQNQPIPEQAQAIREILGVDLGRQIAWPAEETALKEWRAAVEDAGVFVFKNAFKQKDISGFCLTHDQFPVIYLNNSTAKTRQIFSLMHELAHLLCHINGLSKVDPRYIEGLSGRIRTTERFCNAVAAEILIPGADFARASAGLPADAGQLTDEQVARLAARYSVSREAIRARFSAVNPHP